ncbi:uncharacterized protein N7525_003933 [Penicillium rubens]|uniref:uncharacterized protein n=1 Tax=Penicillium rubens TaxID=1108849 RepID=UPI002A5A1611|nr:uncharacterized protein N7525_003933 [Penicillium rubens]KAJ5838745.1 hypothetical protein N7525_003933 [Penicillium rubens]KAJ5866795.1 hypothetical protein N7534_001348 [Penicillium rubens]
MDLALFIYIIYDAFLSYRSQLRPRRVDLANSCGALDSKYDGDEWQKLQGVVAWEHDADLSEAKTHRVRHPNVATRLDATRDIWEMNIRREQAGRRRISADDRAVGLEEIIKR